MATTMPNGTFYTSGEAAEYLELSESIVCRYCRLGKLEAIKAGRDWLIHKKALDAFKKIPRERGNPAFKSR